RPRSPPGRAPPAPSWPRRLCLPSLDPGLVHTGSDDDHLDLAVNAIEAALARCATAELLGDYAGIGSAQPP
ncbi:MAG: hypothetical protein ABW279_14670, partial [Acidimicrobiales bacterium]